MNEVGKLEPEVQASRWATIFRHTAMKFASVGVVNTLLTLVIIFALKSLFGVSDPVANFVGYLAGLVCSFTLNQRWTFQHGAIGLAVVTRFAAAFIFSYVINIAVVLLVIRLGLNHYLAHLAGMPFFTVAFYFSCRDFVFVAAKEGDAELDPAHRVPSWGRWYLAMLVPLAVVLLYRLGAAPIAIWDEARLANNAIEMANKGFSLVTTYGGVPDHWNTKPPLLIWMMAGAIKLFGATEWAVRLPSVLASIATASVMFWFCAVHLKRPLAGFIAVLVMFNMPGYLIVHGARSGDYDAMLALWTTSYLVCGFVLAEVGRARVPALLGLFSLLVVLAFMTKTIQGLIFLPVVLVYLGVRGRLPQILRSRSLYAGMALFLLVAVGYYFAREQADPGYFAVARANDLGGRFGTVIENHKHGPFWYVTQFQFYPWLIPGIVAATLMAWRGAGPQRKVGAYFGAATAFYLIIISSASTKLWWYESPLAPLIGILMGTQADAAWSSVLARFPSRRIFLDRMLLRTCALAGAVLIVADLVPIERRIRWIQADELDRYSVFLRSEAVVRAAPLNMVIVHPGYANGQGDPYYIAPTLFYASALRAAGHTVTVQPASEHLPAGADSIVVCGAAYKAKAVAGLEVQTMATSGECGLFRITARKGDPKV